MKQLIAITNRKTKEIYSVVYGDQRIYLSESGRIITEDFIAGRKHPITRELMIHFLERVLKR